MLTSRFLLNFRHLGDSGLPFAGMSQFDTTDMTLPSASAPSTLDTEAHAKALQTHVSSATQVPQVLVKKDVEVRIEEVRDNILVRDILR